MPLQLTASTVHGVALHCFQRLSEHMRCKLASYTSDRERPVELSEVYELVFPGITQDLFYPGNVFSGKWKSAATTLADPTCTPAIMIVTGRGWKHYGIKPCSQLIYFDDKFYCRISWLEVGKKGARCGLSLQHKKQLHLFFVSCHKLNSSPDGFAEAKAVVARGV